MSEFFLLCCIRYCIDIKYQFYILSVCFSGSIKYVFSFFCPECFWWFMYFYINFVHCSTDFLSEHESCNPTTQNQWPLTENRWIDQIIISHICMYYETNQFHSIVWNFWTKKISWCSNVVFCGKRMSDVICVVLHLTLLDSPSKTTSRCLEKVLLITALSHSYNSPSIGPHIDPLALERSVYCQTTTSVVRRVRQRAVGNLH